MIQLFVLLFLLVLPLSAGAETEVRTGRIRDDMPLLTITAAELCTFEENAERQYLLKATVTADDGSLDQTICWHSSERPDLDRAAALTLLQDYNFDGYADLQLLTAQGSRNVFSALALWNPTARRFDPLITDGQSGQLEMCNPVFFPDTQEVLSSAADGYRYRTETLWSWTNSRQPVKRMELLVYDAGQEMIGESLTLHESSSIALWDQIYPEHWYYGDDGSTYSDRTGAIDQLIHGGGTARQMQIAHTDWVHLRQLDRKDSLSLARLNRGVQVQVLREGCGTDEGWVMVWVSSDALPDAQRPGHALGLTGYIWHRFLTEAPE